jgi:RNA polymerase sigma-70 factor (ECF subfamily)
VYRVAHNVAASHVDRERRMRSPLVTLDEIVDLPSGENISAEVEESHAMSWLNATIRKLGPPDRQIITLYLEGLDAASIAEVTGLSAGAVATRVSRMKSQLARIFQETANV